MKFQFSNKGGFNEIYTNDKFDKHGFVKGFINTESNKVRFAKTPEFYHIPNPISQLIMFLMNGPKYIWARKHIPRNVIVMVPTIF